MPAETSLTELLLRWEELRDQGEEPTPEELCAGCPEQLEELQRRIAALRAVDRKMELASGAAVRHFAGLTVPPGGGDTSDFGGPTAAPTSAARSAGRYTVVRSHARGGLGEVFVAEDTELNRRIALKRIQERHAGSMESRRRFLVEAEITARLEHPGIVPVYGLVTDEHGQPCYAMRFIEGESLHEAIQEFHQHASAHKANDATRFASLEFRQLLQRFTAVCNTIAYAHSRGVLHRDIKPANVMLGKYGETLVVDWGLAKNIDPRPEDRQVSVASTPTPRAQTDTSQDTPQTQIGHAVGTPAFMSPEQAQGAWDIVGPASDIYSLGATLYLLLTGQMPFNDSNLAALLSKLQQGVLPAPRKVIRGVPVALEAICLKAMAREPGGRYATALELASDVERWLADEAVTAYCERWTVRAGRWTRKHRTLVTGVAALLLAVVPLSAALAVISDQARRQAESDKVQIGKQKDIAEANQKEAKERNAETTAVLDFVENKIFAAARPKDQQGGLGHEVKLADAVTAALPFVDQSFNAQPLIEARLRISIGNSFWYLGDAKTSAEQYQAARALLVEHRGLDHPDTLRSMNNLANSYADAGRTQDALKLREETFRLMKTTLGADHPDTLRSMSNLANSYADAGRSEEALRLRQEALERRKAKFGPDHPDTLGSMNSLANSHADEGRAQDAIQLYETTLRLQKAKLGPSHPDTLMSMHNLAGFYTATGRILEGTKLHEEALQLQRVHLGPDHPDTLKSMNDLAVALDAGGRTQEALHLREVTLQAMKTKLGLDHPYTHSCVHNLAGSYYAVGRTKDALQLLEETLALSKAKLGPDHLDTLRSMHNFAVSYVGAGRTQEALELLEETLRRRKAKLGPDHPDTLKCMMSLASTRADAGHTREALSLQEEILPLQKAKLGPDHPSTLISMNNLASSYGAVGRTQEALKLREETLQLQKAKLGPDHPETLISMNNLAISYTATGRAEDALSLLTDTLARRQRRTAAEPDNFMGQSFLAWTLGQIGEAEQARHEYAAAVHAYVTSVAMFDKLDHSGALKHPFFRGQLKDNRRRLALCQKAGQTVRDLDFALKQPEAEVPALLALRVGILLKEQNVTAAVESAARMKERAGDKPDQLYDAACLYALCAGAAKAAMNPAGDATRLTEEAMNLLKLAVAKGYKNVAHMKQDKDLASLRDREDYKNLLAELEARQEKAKP